MRRGRRFGLGFVIDLEADDGGLILDVGDELADDALGVEAEVGVGDVHLLAGAVAAGAGGCDGEDIGVFADEPGGDGVGGGADDDAGGGAVHGLDHAIDVGEIEGAVVGFEGGPGGLADADDGDAGGFHHFDAGGEAVVGFVFLVVGCAGEDGGGARGRGGKTYIVG